MGFKIRTEKEFIIKILLLLLLVVVVVVVVVAVVVVVHLLQCANISSEMLEPCYRTARCYKTEGSAHNFMRIQQDRQKGNIQVHSLKKICIL